MVSQIDLIAGIAGFLEKSGYKTLLPRQLNAVIEAANLIMAELREPERKIEPGMGLSEWMVSDHTGKSSEYMASVLSGGKFRRAYAHPLDPDDFGRCLGLLDACPHYRPHLETIATTSPEWRALVEHWSELEALYREEFPTGKAPRLYAKMNHYYAQARETQAAKV